MLSEHREAIALLTAMVQEVLDEYEEGGAPKLWRKLSRTWRRAEAARVAWDRKKWREAYVQLGVLIERGGEQVDREIKLMSLLEALRKHVESETRRKLAEDNTFTREEGEAFYTGLGAAVRRHVLNTYMTDEEKLRAITEDMATMAWQFGIPQNEDPPE
jgi:hypothetical protein